ncbi:alpha/beta fold hydrolase [Echinicola marina]|uniref:alpha/beta hydrolase family protein n=1 Tax=Echinicola marina TaxID=2859768 RepID=UPI001CF70136|nr:alpha/beta hydrolase [Echinicola marina]UCS92914.1 alpha/beta fold hydrolase [Echinicola marina]
MILRLNQYFLAFSVGFLTIFSLHAQELQGSWKGELDIMAKKLPIIFHFEQEGGDWKGTMDSPTQGATGMAIDKVLHTAPMVSVELGKFNITFEGLLMNDTIKGTFTQSGVEIPLDLIKVGEEELLGQPKQQEPKAPFDYDVIETSFQNMKAGIKLKGTITKPKGMGPFPAVVLVSGSGQQDRNGEVFGHKPFWVIADYLTRKGIAVLRYDERGTGESEGEFAEANSFDFEKDAEVALHHLKKFPFVDQLRSGVVGHSEGGMIAWIMAAETKGLGFAISLAGPTVPISDLMMQQSQDVLSSYGASEELIQEQRKINEVLYQVFEDTEDFKDLNGNLTTALRSHLKEMNKVDSLDQEQIQELEGAYSQMVSPWYFSFMKFNPAPYIRQANIPVLALFAAKDIQVNGPINYQALEDIKNKEGKDNIELKLYPGLNHLFQTAQTGAIDEYAQIGETFSEVVLEDIVAWIKGL